MSTTVLEAVDLYRFYHTGEEETLALRGVSLRVGRGEIVAVLGPSGSGKSTLLAYCAGLDEPDGGQVNISGERITRQSEPRRAGIRARNIGILLQSGNLVDHLSVEENIRLPRFLAGKREDGRVDELLRAVGLGPRRRALPSHPH